MKWGPVASLCRRRQARHIGLACLQDNAAFGAKGCANEGGRDGVLLSGVPAGERTVLESPGKRRLGMPGSACIARSWNVLARPRRRETAVPRARRAGEEAATPLYARCGSTCASKTLRDSTHSECPTPSTTWTCNRPVSLSVRRPKVSALKMSWSSSGTNAVSEPRA